MPLLRPFLAFQGGLNKVSAEEFGKSPESSGPDAASALIRSLLRIQVLSSDYSPHLLLHSQRTHHKRVLVRSRLKPFTQRHAAAMSRSGFNADKDRVRP